MAQIESWFNQDLKEPVKVRYLDGNVFSQDNNGNLIGVYVFDNGEPATLSGSVSASIIRSDGGTVAAVGTLSGNQVSVILPQSAYAIPGVISVVIKLTSGSDVTTLCAVVGNVYTSSTDTVIDPGTIIPSIETLIAAIETAIASVPADYSTLLADIASNYSSSKTYPIVGTYAWYNGVLKRSIVPITTAESYTAAHWTDAIIGDDVSALKSALDSVQEDEIDGYRHLYDWANGTVSSPSVPTPTLNTNNKRIRPASFVSVKAGDKIIIDNNSHYVHSWWLWVGEIGNASSYTSSGSSWVTVNETVSVANDGFFMISFADKTDQTTVLNPASFDGIVEITSYARRHIDVINKDVTYTGVSFTTQVGTSTAYFESDYDNECLFLRINGKWYLRGNTVNGTGDDYADILNSNKETSTQGETNCVKLLSGQGIVYDKSDSTWKVVSLALAANQNPNYVVVFYAGYYENYKLIGVVSGIGQWVYIDYLRQTGDTDLNSKIAKYVGISTRIGFSVENGVKGCFFETDGTTYLYLKIPGKWYLRGYTNNQSNISYADIVPSNRYTSPSGETDCIRLASNDGIVYDLSDSTWKIVALTTRSSIDYNQVPVFVAGYYNDKKQFGVVSGIGQYLYEAYMPDENEEKRSFFGTYRYATQAETLINKVLADRDSDTVTVAVITDCHQSSSNDITGQVDIFNKIAEKCADFSINLGDAINGLSTLSANLNSETTFWEHQKNSKISVMFCRGNHETAGQLTPSPNYVYMGDYPTYSTQGNYTYVGDDPSAIPLKNILGVPYRPNMLDVTYSTSKGNWYFDFNGIRFIGLDGSYRYNGGFNQEGIDFLDSALNTNKKIIVFCHFPANKDANWDERVIQNSSDIETALNTNGNVLAYIHGHTHFDNIMVVSGNNFPYIATCCALPAKGDESKAHPESAVYWDRSINTYTEYCFDIYNIHNDTGVIKIFRFGAGVDREYPIPENE